MRLSRASNRPQGHTFDLNTTQNPSSRAGTLAIEARGLCRRFGPVQAVDRVDLEVATGEVTGILGPNGSGKSTFLRILVGLVRPDNGSARVAGVELKGDGTAVRRRVTFSPGEIALYGELPAHEHLAWLLRGRPAAALTASQAVAERLGLPLQKRVHEFSHGMKRQLLFASAMGPDVAVRILDEPTEGLDPSKRSEVLALIAEDAAKGKTILLSSHHLSEVEEVCDRLVFFFRGQVLADEDPVELKRLAEHSARLEYGSEAEARAAAVVLAKAPGTAMVMTDGKAVRLELEGSGDAFERLASLRAATRDLAAPVSLEVGKLSLTELYERVYGVRGL